ncbi:MAG: ATP-binding protein [Thermotogota bacterium]
MFENLMGIIANENPTNLLRIISKEISEQLQSKINSHNLIFIYEPAREVLRLMGSSVDCELLRGFKIYMGDNAKLHNAIYDKEKTKYVLNDDEKIGCLKNQDEIFIYPIYANNTFLGAVGLFENNYDVEELNSEFSTFAVLMNLVMEALSIEELREKVKLLENLTEIIEDVMDKDELIKNIIKDIHNFLHAQVSVFWEFDEEKNNLVLKHHQGIDNKNIIKDNLPLENTFEGESLSENSGRIIIGRKFYKDKDKPFDIDFRSSMYSKIVSDNKVLGIIAIYNRKKDYGYRPYKHFDNLDLAFLTDASKRTGLAINRIYLYDKLREEIKKLKKFKKSNEQLINIQKNQLEKMNALHKISQAIRSTYDKNNAIKIMLLGLTSGRGLKYNRALYLERDKVRGFLIPKLWVGPSEDEDISEAWEQANQKALKYGDLVQFLREEALNMPNTNKLTESISNNVLAYKGHPVLERVVSKRQIVNVTSNVFKVKNEELEDIYDIIKNEEFLIFPIAGRFETKGIIIIDNKFNKEPINDIDSEILRLFMDSIGLAMETIDNYNELRNKTKSLEEQKNLMDYYRRFKENVLQNLAVGIIVVDRQGKIIEWNEKAENFFSKPRENVIGNSINLMSSTFGDDIINTIETIIETEESLKYPNYKLKIGDETKIFDIQFSLLRNREVGYVEGVILGFDDVTEIYSLQQEMEKREKLAAIGEMTSRIAHEIRNPLTVIGGFLKRLYKKMDDPKSVKKYAGIIDDELSRLEVIVSEILEYSRGKKLPEFEEIDLNNLIDDVLMMYEDFIEQKDITLEREKNVDNIYVDLDRNRIKQVLINLLKNAIEVVPKEGRIEIKSGIDEKHNAFFQIKNNGDTIPEEDQEKLFMPFFTTKTHGTGLGLPICKKIIEDEHKGNLYLVKSDGDGTIFRFEIPLDT